MSESGKIVLVLGGGFHVAYEDEDALLAFEQIDELFSACGIDGFFEHGLNCFEFTNLKN